MPISNAFFKTLLGLNAQVLIGKQVQYCDDATYALFVANAVEGEIGVFKTADLTAFNGAGAAAATDEVFIAVKRDGLIEKSVPFTVGQIKASRTAYEAPVKQVTTVYSGSVRASLVRGDLTFYAKAIGVDGNDVSVVFVDPAGNNAALSIGVVGKAITVNLATDGASAPTSTAQQVKDAIDASPAALALVSVVITGAAATVQAAIANANLASGAAPAALAAKDVIGIKVLDMTPGAQPFPTYNWEVVAKSGETWDQAFVRLAGVINSTTDKANRDRDLIVSAAYVAADDALTLTAVDFGTTFRVQLTGKLYDGAGEVVYTTPAKIGSGFPAQVKLLQDQGDLYKGVTTQYPLQGANPEDFGKPTDFVSSALTYNIYVISGYKNEASRTPHHLHAFGRNIIVAVPASGASAEEEIKTIFSL